MGFKSPRRCHFEFPKANGAVEQSVVLNGGTELRDPEHTEINCGNSGESPEAPPIAGIDLHWACGEIGSTFYLEVVVIRRGGSSPLKPTNSRTICGVSRNEVSEDVFRSDRLRSIGRYISWLDSRSDKAKVDGSSPPRPTNFNWESTSTG